MKYKKLNEIIEFNSNYKTAINLYLSLNKEEKVLNYIPTNSSVLFLDEYMRAVLENREHATLLIGPYGKGKSHLLLVLLALVSLERVEKNEKIIKQLKSKINKIEEIGEKIASDIDVIWEKNRFLPKIEL